MDRVAISVLLGLCLPGVPVLAVRLPEKDCIPGFCPCKGKGYVDLFSSSCPPTYRIENGQRFKLTMKCYRFEDDSQHVRKNEEGVCLVAHRKRCQQTKIGDELSGGCRGRTVCRNFNYVEVTPFGHDQLRQKSYCIDENDKADQRLKFLGSNVQTLKEDYYNIPADIPGHDCTGGGVLDVWHSGTCVQPTVEENGERFSLELKCYKLDDESHHAAEGEPGTCWVAHGKRCVQRTPGDEESGDCRGATVCRKFNYLQWKDDLEVGALGQKVLAQKSFCIDEKDSRARQEKVLQELGETVVPPDFTYPGDACWGSDEWEPFRRGTCPTTVRSENGEEFPLTLECFSTKDPNVYAGKNEAGRCLIPHGARCIQGDRRNALCSGDNICTETRAPAKEFGGEDPPLQSRCLRDGDEAGGVRWSKIADYFSDSDDYE